MTANIYIHLICNISFKTDQKLFTMYSVSSWPTYLHQVWLSSTRFGKCITWTSQGTSHSTCFGKPVLVCTFPRTVLAIPKCAALRCSLVNHTLIAIFAYCQVSLLHLGGVRQWFIGGSVPSLRALTTFHSRVWCDNYSAMARGGLWPRHYRHVPRALTC